MAFVVDAIVTVIVTLVTQPKPVEELQGLVYGMANVGRARAPRTSGSGIASRGCWASGALGLAAILNIVFI